ncbi:MAG: hypothetical protein IT269_05535 [Saprospiraceae bacterium]|nr:hypothetical protein [Saprospiraceae bacterium]
MSDREILQRITTNYELGWEALYRKYHTPQRMLKIGGGYVSNYDEDQLDKAWSDAIQATCSAVRNNRFSADLNQPDFFAPFIASIAQRNLLKEKRKPIQPAQPEDDQHEEVIVYEIDSADMFMLHFATYALRDLYRDIILLKYFPDNADDFGLTDHDLNARLVLNGYNMRSRSELGVERRRAIRELGKLRKKMDKEQVEKSVLAQGMEDFTLVSMSYPTAQLFALMFNKGKALAESHREKLVVSFLQDSYARQQPELNPRLRLYPDNVTDWMNYVFSSGTQWNIERVANQVKIMLGQFASRFFPPKN